MESLGKVCKALIYTIGGLVGLGILGFIVLMLALIIA